jgi:hypothetical protein
MPQPVFGTAGSATSSANPTFNLNIAGSDLFLVVEASVEDGGASATVTVNGAAIPITAWDGTSGVIANNGTNNRIFGLRNPPTGATVPLVLTTPGGAPKLLAAAYYRTVDQTTPFDGLQTSTDTGLTPFVTVSSGSNNLVVGGIIGAAPTPPVATADGSQALRQALAASVSHLIISDETGATSVDHRYARTDVASFGSLLFGFSLRGTSGATPNLFLGDNAVAGQNFGELELAAPTAATSPTGWTVAGLAVGQMARMAFGVERAAGVFSATAQPSGAPDAALGDGYRTAAALNGSYAAGTWTIQIPMLAVDAAGANLRARIRLWRSANADMSGATEITSGAVIGTTVTALGTVTPQISTCTVALGTVTLTNEFLFLQIAAEVV